MCEACQRGDHKGCTVDGCDCPDRKLEEEIEREVAAHGLESDSIAETIYSNLLFGGSQICRMMTDGAGKERTLAFIKQVLRACKAFRN